MDMIRSFRKQKKKKEKEKGGTERARKKEEKSGKVKKNAPKSERKNKKRNGGPSMATEAPTIIQKSDIFDPNTFTFKFDKVIAPSADSHSDGQTAAFETFAKVVIAQGVNGIVKEFASEIVPFLPVGHYSRTIFDAYTPMKKNRYKDVICNDMTRVSLKDGRQGDYIHANYVRGLQPTFILTQGPTQDTLFDFWRMIVQEKVSAICMLCEFMENGKRKCDVYFPDVVGATMTLGDFVILCETSGQQDSHTFVTSLSITDKLNNKTSKVTHYKIITWPDKTVAKSNLCLLRTLRILRTCPNAVVVHCSAGIGRTGTFVAIEVGVQAILNEKVMKLSDIVKAIRHCRINSVQMDTQYLMLAESVIECGKSYTYIDDSEILKGFDGFKKQIAEYVIAHPPPVEVVKAPTAAPLQDKVDVVAEPPPAPTLNPTPVATPTTPVPILNNQPCGASVMQILPPPQPVQTVQTNVIPCQPTFQHQAPQFLPATTVPPMPPTLPATTVPPMAPHGVSPSTPQINQYQMPTQQIPGNMYQQRPMQAMPMQNQFQQPFQQPNRPTTPPLLHQSPQPTKGFNRPVASQYIG